MSIHLSARDLACGRGRHRVLSGVELSLERGRRLALVGPNGAGKSTLLRVVAGLDRPHAGTIELDGDDLTRLAERERARRLAVVSQHELPPADLRVHELVALGRLPHRSPWRTTTDRGETDGALNRLGLAHLADRSVDEISGGELRRVLLARAIAQEAELLVLDEPTNHLDLRHQHELLEVVAGLGVSVVAAIHDLDLAMRYFDEIAVIADGTLLPARPAAEALSQDLLEEVFGVVGTRVQHPTSGRWHLIVEPQQREN